MLPIRPRKTRPSGQHITVGTTSPPVAFGKLLITYQNDLRPSLGRNKQTANYFLTGFIEYRTIRHSSIASSAT
jgi:hypothetical protein